MLVGYNVAQMHEYVILIRNVSSNACSEGRQSQCRCQGRLVATLELTHYTCIVSSTLLVGAEKVSHITRAFKSKSHSFFLCRSMKRYFLIFVFNFIFTLLKFELLSWVFMECLIVLSYGSKVICLMFTSRQNIINSRSGQANVAPHLECGTLQQ